MSQCSGSYVATCGIAKIFVDLAETIVIRIAQADSNAGTNLMHDRHAYRRKPRAVAQAARLDVSMRDSVVVLLGLIILILVIGKSGVMV